MSNNGSEIKAKFFDHKHMRIFGPLPRFRLYTTPGSYLNIARDTLLVRSDRGNDLLRFVESVRDRTGLPFALCMPQARVGIFLAVRALISPGQKVILSPYTIHDVINMVICAGGVPVFADIERETCNMNPREVERLIDRDTGAVLVTHLHGLTMEVEGIAKLCREKGLALIEDAAQAFGTRLHGQMVGTFGDAGIYSFGMYKNLNTFYGGMVVTRHEDLQRRLSAELSGFPLQELSVYLKKVAEALMADLATYPPFFRGFTFRLFRFGYLHDIEFLNKRIRVEDNPQLRRGVPENYLRRMRSMQARIGLCGLCRVDEDIQARISFAHMYHEGLNDLNDLILPPFRVDGSHTYTYYAIQFKDRHALVRHLMRKGCDLAVQHLKNCADLPCFEAFNRDCPNARATANETILLPTYPRYSRADVERNIRAIREFFGCTGVSS